MLFICLCVCLFVCFMELCHRSTVNTYFMCSTVEVWSSLCNCKTFRHKPYLDNFSSLHEKKQLLSQGWRSNELQICNMRSLSGAFLFEVISNYLTMWNKIFECQKFLSLTFFFLLTCKPFSIFKWEIPFKQTRHRKRRTFRHQRGYFLILLKFPYFRKRI